MRISIEAFGETELSRELLRFVDRVDDMKPAFDAIHKRFIALEVEQFQTEGSAGPSGAWAPLSQGTIDAKVRAGLPANILQATGRLRDSLTKIDGADAVFRQDKDSAFFGSTVPYGVFHQSRQPRHVLPRRPPVDIPEISKKEWLKVLQGYIVKGHLS